MNGMTYEPLEKYINEKYHFYLELPQQWIKNIRENPAGDTAVIYNADGNVIRLIASDNKAIRDYIPKIMESPFVTEIVTDTGLKEKISIGGSKSDPSRVVAWAFTERDGTLFHIVADLSFSFAVGNKDILMNVAKSFGFEKSEAVCGK